MPLADWEVSSDDEGDCEAASDDGSSDVTGLSTERWPPDVAGEALADMLIELKLKGRLRAT